MTIGEKHNMAAEPKRFRLSDETAKVAIQEARIRPVIVEVNGTSYEVNARDIAEPRFTARSVRGSLPPLLDRKHISDDELEDIIRDANEQHAREIMEQSETERP